MFLRVRCITRIHLLFTTALDYSLTGNITPLSIHRILPAPLVMRHGEHLAAAKYGAIPWKQECKHDEGEGIFCTFGSGYEPRRFDQATMLPKRPPKRVDQRHVLARWLHVPVSGSLARACCSSGGLMPPEKQPGSQATAMHR